MLSDWHPKGRMGSDYGVYSKEKGYTLRSTVIIDKDGVVRWSEPVPSGERRYATKLVDVCRKVLAD